ncbi:hypothetical protein CONPUDRAFT_123111 [Coniophora puteana RWD-64-598 SS2]|uniref:RING-type E3 ubiquitin transferase (cysteine targeting) n=1 Tax=Coniophora puteana (strain RWD-64-598) TaxID=741705 RepID=A0A5M3MT24_CONPW|nr:uncharacterized protein CONPUDRAFT_123111 [Coniophora puteana RWD-64-598 SS2]EIW82319.1 hypothetical protein CONPUDRAFT_123111 [Coniophora puteana RWD-64-598 SS2]
MSSTNSTWQTAWDSAQSSLNSIRDLLHSEPSPEPRIIRVGQLDAELLDAELVNLLQEPLNKALALINAALKARFEPELSLIIQLTLYKLSVWDTGASYGAKLQGLKYAPHHARSHPSSLGSRLPRRLLLLHGTLTILIPYVHNRIRDRALSHAWPDTPSSDPRRKAWDFLTRLEATHALLGLGNFIAFLWNGRYRTLSDRLLHMSLEPAQSLTRREVSYEFMNRQMVWHAFTEFLLFLLPLVNRRALQKRWSRLKSTLKNGASSLMPSSIMPSSSQGRQVLMKGKFHALSPEECAICAENASFNLNLSDSANALTAYLPQTQPQVTEEDEEAEESPPQFPIYTPYVTSCGHTYCYHCIAERMMRAVDDGDDEFWECLRCMEPVRSADRVEGEVSIDRPLTPDSDYEFSDMTDMDDGSIGSYSYTGSSDHE